MGVNVIDLYRDICRPVLKLGFYGPWHNGVPFMFLSNQLLHVKSICYMCISVLDPDPPFRGATGSEFFFAVIRILPFYG
jgi:hypothetical protein